MEHQRWVRALIVVCLFSGLELVGQEDEHVTARSHEDQKSRHIALKDDIQAVGMRNIGGKGFGNWYSPEQEIGMGGEYSREIEASIKLVRDPVVTEYVQRLGQNLVRNSDAKVPFTIKVIDSEEINAFALPGGFLYVNSGLILAAQEEAELAGVMAHEIAHVAAHHASRQMTHSQMFTLATLPLIFVGGGLGVAVREAVGLAMPVTMTRFSRAFETEADYLGVEYLYQAGYDPQAFISFWERVQVLEKQKPGVIAKMFSNHPQTADRIRKTQAEIVKILPPREAYVISSSDFDDVKSRLGALENQHPPREHDPNGPILRRRESVDHDTPEAGDERPTLRRQSEQ
jgi:beta-barrel assembly-enhancing protease